MMVAILGAKAAGKTQFMLSCQKSLWGVGWYRGYKVDMPFAERRKRVGTMIENGETTGEIVKYEIDVLQKEGLFKRSKYDSVTWFDYRGENLNNKPFQRIIAEKIMEREDFKAFLLFFDMDTFIRNQTRAVDEFDLMLRIHDDVCRKTTGDEKLTFVVFTKTDLADSYDMDNAETRMKECLHEHGVSAHYYKSSIKKRMKCLPVDVLLDIMEKCNQ